MDFIQIINPLTGKKVKNNTYLGKKIVQSGGSNRDLQLFLKSVKPAEFKLLGHLIINDRKSDAINLTCKLVTNYFKYIPENHCNYYGQYIYTLLESSLMTLYYDKYYWTKLNAKIE